MVGGGVRGKVVGTAHVIMIGAGVIMTMFQDSIMMWTQVGEDTTEIVIGVGTGGIMNGFRTGGFKRTGRAGTIIDTGEGKGPGVSRAIEIDRHSNSDRNSDIEESRNITRGLRFRNISSGDKSEKDKEGIKARKAENIEVEKAGKIEVRGDTRIRSDDI